VSTATGAYNSGARIAANSVQVRFQKSDLPGLLGFSTGDSAATDASTNSGTTSINESSASSGTSPKNQSSGGNENSSNGSQSSNSMSSSGIDSPSNGDPAKIQQSPSLSPGAKAGIGVGAALGVIAIAAAVFAFFYLLRRARRNTQTEHLDYYAHHEYSTKVELGADERRQHSGQAQSFTQPPVSVRYTWAKRIPDLQPLPPGEMDAGYPYPSELSSTGTLRSTDNKSVHSQSVVDHGQTER
jgi:hypothetical protein